jgi:hypothetical protein
VLTAKHDVSNNLSSFIFTTNITRRTSRKLQTNQNCIPLAVRSRLNKQNSYYNLVQDILSSNFLSFINRYRIVMLRWFPRLQVATACFSCSPPHLNFLDPYYIFMYVTGTRQQPTCSSIHYHYFSQGILGCIVLHPDNISTKT